MAGKFSLMGVLGLRDDMTPTLKKVSSQARTTTRDVNGLNQVILGLGSTMSSKAASAMGLQSATQGVRTYTAALSKAEVAAKRQNDQAQLMAAKIQRADAMAKTAEINRQRAALKLAKMTGDPHAGHQNQTVQQAIMQTIKSPAYRSTRNPIVKWLQTSLAQGEVTQARSALEQAARSAPRFVEMARAGETPAHLHGASMQKRWAQIQGMAQAEKTAMARLEAARGGAIVNPLTMKNLPALLGQFKQPLTNAAQTFGNLLQTGVSKTLNLVKSAGSMLFKVVSAPFKLLNSTLGLLGVAGGVYGIKQLVQGALDFSGNMEQAQIAFTTMLGSASQAKTFVQDLFTFAAKTPFQFPEVTQNARMLLAMGFSAKQALDWLTPLGNAVSALGASDEVFQRVILAIGQINAKGKLMGEEIRQLAETGIPVVEILAKKLGMTKAEIMEGGRAGITAERALKALYEGLNEKYKGGMAAQSKSWFGLLSTIKDFATSTWGALGDGIRERLQPALQGILGWFERSPEKVKAWRQKLYTFGYAAGNSLVDAVERAMERIDKLMGTADWQNADLFGKVRLAWDALIAQPFADWWNGAGKAKVTQVANSMGAFLGATIAGAVRAAFGLGDDGSMVNAGATAGAAFVRGFIDEIKKIDWGQVLKEAWTQNPKTTAALTLFAVNSVVKSLFGVGVGSLFLRGLGGLFVKGGAAAASGTAAAAEVAAAGGTAAAGGAASTVAASALATAGTIAGSGILGWILGRYVIGPGADKLLNWTDRNLPGGWGYTDRQLQREKDLTKQLQNTPTTIGPAGGPAPLPPLHPPATSSTVKQEVQVSVAVTRADTEDDDRLAGKVANRIMLALKAHYENS